MVRSKNMPKKSQRRGVKRKTRSSRKPLAAKGVSQRMQSLPPPPKQAPVAKPPVTVVEQPVRYPYVLSELRRTAVIAGGILVLLVALYFILR